jgi:hypothetical protein
MWESNYVLIYLKEQNIFFTKRLKCAHPKNDRMIILCHFLSLEIFNATVCDSFKRNEMIMRYRGRNWNCRGVYVLVASGGKSAICLILDFDIPVWTCTNLPPE